MCASAFDEFYMSELNISLMDNAYISKQSRLECLWSGCCRALHADSATLNADTKREAPHGDASRDDRMRRVLQTEIATINTCSEH